MTGPDEAIHAASDGLPRPGLLGKLVAAIRPEFRAETRQFAADDPVFGGDACRVVGCPRSACGRGLCSGHRQRWVTEGRPDMDSFAATTDRRWRRHQPNASCQVAGCGYGVARGGMCQLHAQRWERAGRPDLDAWLADPPPVKQPASGATCRVDHCTLWPRARLPFCHSHANTWKVNGRPDIDGFAARFTDVPIRESEMIRLDRLNTQLRLEIQYALQCRHDERTTKTAPAVVMQVVRFLAGAGVGSLLDRTEEAWRGQIGRPAKESNPRALLIYARRKVEDLVESDGWEAEYPRDVWQLRRLGFDGYRTLRFDGIGQPWLREPAKRWVRWRLSGGLGPEAAAGRPVRVLTRFSGFLATTGVEKICQLDRAVLERYLADLHAEMAGTARHGTHIGLLNAFFSAIRQHGWDDRLPATATFFAEDYPKRGDRLPRALAEHVMTQVEHPGNLARWGNPAYRLVTLILIRCGLRISDALRLPPDCVVTDADGAPYLRYHNHKMKREALVPIDEELAQLIREQQQRVLGRWPEGVPVLFPRPTKNVDGQAPTSSSTYRLALYRWLQRCDVRDEQGRPVRLNPHQWRHSLGTRLINRDVPQEVVRKILDHDSPCMTSHYANSRELQQMSENVQVACRGRLCNDFVRPPRHTVWPA